MASIEEIADSIEEPKQHIHDHDHDHDHEGEGSDVELGGKGQDVTITDAIASKSERKARKQLQGIGLKKVQGINRVTMRRPRGYLLVVTNPEVYKSSVSDVYVVFGELKTEDMSAQAQAAQAQQLAQQEQQERMLSEQFSQLSSGAGAEKKKEEEEEEDESEPIDEEGVDAKDIDLVISQTSCSRRRAVKALKEHQGDLINAIMAVS